MMEARKKEVQNLFQKHELIYKTKQEIWPKPVKELERGLFQNLNIIPKFCSSV